MENNIPKNEIEVDLSKFKKFEAMSNSEGGKELKSLCLKDIINSVDILASKYSTISHVELIAECIVLKERLGMYRLLKNSKENVSLAEEALKDALDTDE